MDYEARMYDASIARCTGVDPIADQFAWASTYNYAENRPIGSIDLHGLQEEAAIEAAMGIYTPAAGILGYSITVGLGFPSAGQGAIGISNTQMINNNTDEE